MIRPLTPAARPPAEHREIFRTGDTLWQLHGDHRAALFDADGLRLERWLADGSAVEVKRGAGRTIHRVRLPGLDFYVKHFRSPRLTTLVHHMFRQGRAEKEFTLAAVLDRCHVNTVYPLALGERRRRGVLVESWLVTEAIPNGLTLFDLIENHVGTPALPDTVELRRHIADELARLAATVHDHGIEHRDLHERNIVVQPAGAGRFRFFLLDLHELRRHRTLSWALARRELTRMGRYFTIRTTHADRLRFLKAYLRERHFPPNAYRTLAPAVEHQTAESRADFWRRRDVRKVRKNPRLVQYRDGAMRAEAVTDLPEELVRSLMAAPDRPFDHNVHRWWKIGRVTRVAEVDLPAAGRTGENLLIYKQYYFKGWLESLSVHVRHNQAMRAWNNGRSLLLRELPTPRPLALIQRFRYGVPVTSYLLTERVPDAQTIPHYLERHLPHLPPRERRRVLRGVIHQSATMLRRLHERRVTHRDLKASNVLVTPTADLARPKLWLIDLDGVQTWQTVPEDQRLQNLARFYVSFHHNRWLSASDRLQFLRTYLPVARRADWRRLWRETLERAERKIRRNLRRGRSVV